MRELSTIISISAPISEVWNILTDFENWPAWNPIVNKTSGSISMGSALKVTMSGSDGKDAQSYSPMITKFEEPNYFRWRAKMMAEFLFTNDKVLELSSDGEGTKIVHKELFSGMLVPLFWNKLSQGVTPMLESMNEALKKEAEKASHTT